MAGVGKHTRTPATREKLRQANLGKVLSAETRAKIGAAHRGRVVSAETRAKLSATQSGSGNHRWKGGRIKHGQGYIYVHVPDDHPFAEMRSNKRYIGEHRLVMAEKIGRSLHPDETVHHLNGNRADNRPENLELRMGRHGRGFNVDEIMCPNCGHILKGEL